MNRDIQIANILRSMTSRIDSEIENATKSTLPDNWYEIQLTPEELERMKKEIEEISEISAAMQPQMVQSMSNVSKTMDAFKKAMANASAWISWVSK